VVIASPYLSKGRIMQMQQSFETTALTGARVVIVTRPPESFRDSSRSRITALIAALEASGIKVVLLNSLYQKFAVIDRALVWYGSIGLLAYGKEEDSVMRFENSDISEELLLMVEGKSGSV
jgi:hypothetical protein